MFREWQICWSASPASNRNYPNNVGEAIEIPNAVTICDGVEIPSTL